MIGLLLAFFLVSAPAPGIGSVDQTLLASLEGDVRDETGAAIPGAMVVYAHGSLSATVYADSAGHFVLARASVPGRISVSAVGFAGLVRTVDPASPAPLQITLRPASLSEEVTVTAERRPARVSDTAASVSILSREELRGTAALMLDDALRQVPGFSLFRRSGSRTANPTSQGVSLRGVGASGASRASVMSDGVPLNDPFGGWVYWGRTPRQSIDRVEIVRGGASSLYGTDALGGVINLVPREANGSVLSVDASYGGQGSATGSAFAAHRLGAASAQLSLERFHSDGYIQVDKAQRGRVDTRAGATYSTLDLRLAEVARATRRLFIRGSLFHESRENGTPLQTNRTSLRQLSAGADLQGTKAGRGSFRAYVGSQDYEQAFSAVAAARNSESLTRQQQTPARHFGATSLWSGNVGPRHILLGGLELREVRGESDEVVIAGGRATSSVSAGGLERTVALFAQDTYVLANRLVATVGGRLDRWHNLDGRASTTPLATNVTATRTFTPRTEAAFSPRVSLLYRLNPGLTLTASGYRAFRAPTLNELYRSFRVGNVVTQGNDRLLAERLTGGEAGARVFGLHGRVRASGSLFWSEVERPIANVTISATADLTTRERRNLGRTRSRGIELEGEARFGEKASLSLGYLFVDPRVLSFAANRSLEGLQLPQVARHQFTFQARYVNPAILSVSLQGRVTGAQFDDDQNLLSLAQYPLLDVLGSRRLVRGLELFAAVENVFDRRYEVGRSGVTTIGAPRLVRAGVRLSFGPG